MSKIYYAVKFGPDRYWTRGTSPTPSLFLTENNARATIRRNTAYADDEYEIVRFVEVA